MRKASDSAGKAFQPRSCIKSNCSYVSCGGLRSFASRRPNNHWGKMRTSYVNTRGENVKRLQCIETSLGAGFKQTASCQEVQMSRWCKLFQRQGAARGRNHDVQKNPASGNSDVPGSSAGPPCCLPPAAALQTCPTCSSRPCGPPAGCKHKHSEPV